MLNVVAYQITRQRFPAPLKGDDKEEESQTYKLPLILSPHSTRCMWVSINQTPIKETTAGLPVWRATFYRAQEISNETIINNYYSSIHDLRARAHSTHDEVVAFIELINY